MPNAVMPGHCPHVNVLRTTTFMNTPRSVLGRLTAPPRPMHTCAADPYVLSKLEETEKQYLELQEKMADPDVSGNQTQYQKLVKACSDIQDQVEAYQQYKETERQLEDAKAMIKECESAQDTDMLEFAREEQAALAAALETLGESLKVLLLPKDPLDDKNIMLEVRAGTGGEEAALWASDLIPTVPEVRPTRRAGRCSACRRAWLNRADIRNVCCRLPEKRCIAS